MSVDDQPEKAKTPLGHPISSHHVLGWCGYCPGRTAAEELAAWQVWAASLPEVAEEVRRQQGG
jgi:hypothetical protein